MSGGVGRQRRNRGGAEVREREKERAEGGVEAAREGGGFVLGMQGRSWSGGEELDIHRGEDFST